MEFIVTLWTKVNMAHFKIVIFGKSLRRPDKDGSNYCIKAI